MPDWTSARVKALRDALGLSQSEFALAIGVTANTVARWEAGTREPKSYTAVKGLERLERQAKKGGVLP